MPWRHKWRTFGDARKCQRCNREQVKVRIDIWNDRAAGERPMDFAIIAETQEKVLENGK